MQQEPFESQASNRFFNDCFQLMACKNLQLPTIPNVANKIRTVIFDEQTNLTKIGQLVQFDLAISAHLIKAANTSLIAQDQAIIASCAQALTYLGLEQAQELIFSLTLKSVFIAQSPIIKKRMKVLWAHCSFVAALSAILAMKTPRFDPDQAMLAGLVHEIGMLPILILADKNQDILAKPKDLAHTIKMLKNGIGIQIIESWNFPKEFGEIIKQADNWFLDDYRFPNYADIIMVAKLHSHIGTRHINKVPRFDEVPGYHKLVDGQLDATRSRKLLNEAKELLKQTQDSLELIPEIAPVKFTPTRVKE